MSSLLTTESILTTIFITARIAARPRIIPLYATPIPSRPRCTLSLHHILPSKPYICVRPWKPTINISSVSAPGQPESPLTPLDPEPALLEPHLILIPPPHSSITISNAGWMQALVKNYRRIAREAVDAYLDYCIRLADQDANALLEARDHIEQAVPHFQAHMNHWGTDVLLRDQLKSKKDTQVKVDICKEKKNGATSA
ncbi:hypothetical protein GYMLUDRAFT_251601 [Collybiopsis luxurians FD-317 M1]|uniref:Uncharacterized protein n=1 Tax=Collybiopsis luxurians FD-317 M1 TaxID=944289 RepID=A0A0D0BQY9_9AGAR|nr:hypothetical protein GYMLUDRAFT_251601 [Collybiopsis luxurians FD-317 M1]